MDQTYHTPALVSEVVELFRPLGSGIVVDATYGGGGHTRALLGALPELRVIALDRDPDATAEVLQDPRFRFVQANFADLSDVLLDLVDPEGPPHERATDDLDGSDLAGVLFDLGVRRTSSGNRPWLLVSPHGPLDMRMGPDTELTADQIINSWPVDELARIFRAYGEERFARRIAEAVVRHRPIGDTTTLAGIVADAVPAAARRKRHPARKVFQAIRIAVNDELPSLERGLDAAIRWVRPRGRVAVIAYHSLEDRIVKRRFAAGTAGCECPPDLPVCALRASDRTPVARPQGYPANARGGCEQPACQERSSARCGEGCSVSHAHSAARPQEGPGS